VWHANSQASATRHYVADLKCTCGVCAHLVHVVHRFNVHMFHSKLTFSVRFSSEFSKHFTSGNSRYNETRYNGFHVITNAPSGTDLAP
jgi:hypothetical protein